MSKAANDGIMGLDDDNASPFSSTRQLTLLSRDHQAFNVSKEAASISELLKTMMEGDSDAHEVQLYHIESAVIEKVIEYMKYHAYHPARIIEKPIQSTSLTDLVDAWDVHYIEHNVDQELLCKLLLAANYLNIKSLIALTCAKMATMIKGKTAEQIKQTFHIRLDGTPAEEQEIQREYKDLIG